MKIRCLPYPENGDSIKCIKLPGDCVRTRRRQGEASRNRPTSYHSTFLLSHYRQSLKTSRSLSARESTLMLTFKGLLTNIRVIRGISWISRHSAGFQTIASQLLHSVRSYVATQQPNPLFFTRG